MSGLEKEIEKFFTNTVERLGGQCLKFTSPGNAGVPDRLVIWPTGEYEFIEFKKDKTQHPRPLQNYWIKKLRKLNAEVSVIHTRAEAKELLGWRKEALEHNGVLTQGRSLKNSKVYESGFNDGFSAGYDRGADAIKTLGGK